MPIDDPNVGAAFAVVCAAGAATSVGASVVFFPSLVKLASRRVLAAGLGISAGVRTYIAFVEIFNKTTGYFSDAGNTHEYAFLYTTLSFFGGIALMSIIEFIVHWLGGGNGHEGHHLEGQGTSQSEVFSGAPEVTVPHVGHSDDPVHELEELQDMAEEMGNRNNCDKTAHTGETSHLSNISCSNISPKKAQDCEGSASMLESFSCDCSNQSEEEMGENLDTTNAKDLSHSQRKFEDEAICKESHDDVSVVVDMTEVKHEKKDERKGLFLMGMSTTLAIAIHNFPEGLAAFMATLDDPAIGAVFAIAIAIHNIPEGFCVALPMYYATGNRWKAFGWACVAGISEPAGASLGWAILANYFTDNIYASLFGLVSGIMVLISMKELLPTAHKYDPEDKAVTSCFVFGMVIMAASLVAFMM